MLEREEILKEVQKYFNARELVCDHTYKKWGEKSWQFLDTMYLHCLVILRRDILQRPMICNHAGHYQRGLRCNRCELVRTKKENYLSAHVLGKAGDFTVSGMTAEEARKKIKQYSYLFPCQVRIEKDVAWLHFDVLPTHGSKAVVTEFKG